MTTGYHCPMDTPTLMLGACDALCRWLASFWLKTIAVDSPTAVTSDHLIIKLEQMENAFATRLGFLVDPVYFANSISYLLFGPDPGPNTTGLLERLYNACTLAWASLEKM